MEKLELIYQAQKEISVLSGIIELLGWDEETNLPEDALEGRAEQVKLIEVLIHRNFLSARLWYAVNKALPTTKKDALVLKELKREISKQRRIPQILVEEIAHQEIICRKLWKDARAAKDASLFLPGLKRMIKLKRRYAQLVMSGSDNYSALLSEFEPGIDSSRLDKIFSRLRDELLSIKEAIAQREYIDLKTDRSMHKKLVKDIVYSMGIEKRRLVFGVSMHPFSTQISRNDVRITTRLNDSVDILFDAMHEAGHALYDLNLPKEYLHTVLFSGSSIGLHESQSTLWEIFIGKSMMFWQDYYKQYKQVLKQPCSLDAFMKNMHSVGKPLKRLDADILNYCLHILIRYEIERDLILGKIDVSDISRLWKERMKDYIGVVPENDAEGFLQDIHWADGDFGYFPTYLIGLMYAAQIFEKMQKDIPEFENCIRRHEFHPIKDWLAKNIHSYGKTLSSEKIIMKATGNGLSPEPLLRQIKRLVS
ncbi:carboxypeptidase M32 [Candidatus Woesearchaeota archaeon]|nr:carboxypeptidase M32 [Candidatus Woesearchaeota archaeon]